MIKQLFLPIILVAVFIIAVGMYVKKGGTLPTVSPSPVPVRNQKIVKIGSKEIFSEIADSTESRTKGLSGRTSLSEDGGMLFIFPAQDNQSFFWMKGMKISLDIIWIDNGKIIDIDKNVPAPSENTPESFLPKYDSGGKFDYVLEVNAGFTNKNDIKVGDSVILPTL